MAGDIFGAPHEGKKGTTIQKEGIPTEFIKGQSMGARGENYPPAEQYFARYTDDTLNMLALLDMLIVNGGNIDLNTLMEKTIANSKIPLFRGYPEGVLKLFKIFEEDKVPAQDLSISLYGGEGSFANGAPVKITPLALLLHNENNLNIIYQKVKEVLLPTHVHPEAVDGAFIMTIAIKYLLNQTPQIFDKENKNKFIDYILENISQFKLDNKYRDRFKFLKRSLGTSHWYMAYRFLDYERMKEDTAAKEDYVNMKFQVESIVAVPIAFWAFLSSPNNPLCAYQEILNLGGDTDSLCALVGTLLGSLHGLKAIPNNWIIHMNIEEYGLARLKEQAKSLYNISLL